MEKRGINSMEVTPSSGNVFADLDLPSAETLKIKSALVIEITRALGKLGLTQGEAATRLGLSSARVANMLSGDFTSLSVPKLMDCLNQLGFDIEIKVKSTAKALGHLTVR